ncbi:MAG: hypothetical protein AB8B55_01160 [Mariniblastus sp.]
MTQPTALSTLIKNTVDYAGLFPPAALPMEQVIENYGKYLRSANCNMLGRLIIPAAKLETTMIPDHSDSPWQISALLPPCVDGDPAALVAGIEQIKAFNLAHSKTANCAVVDAVEIKVPTTQSIRTTVELLTIPVNAFLEVSWDDPRELIAEIASTKNPNIFAKIRTGAVTPELIPSPDKVARFIQSCAEHNLGFKATAGLHHPMRAQQNLTYEPDSPQAKMHGFLNVFVAAVIAFEHGKNTDSESTLTEILSNEQADKFRFEDDQLSWGDLSVSTERVAKFRAKGIISFGSCSFTEPSNELAELAY